jgi:hypothetical protein
MGERVDSWHPEAHRVAFTRRRECNVESRVFLRRATLPCDLESG